MVQWFSDRVADFNGSGGCSCGQGHRKSPAATSEIFNVGNSIKNGRIRNFGSDSRLDAASMTVLDEIEQDMTEIDDVELSGGVSEHVETNGIILSSEDEVEMRDEEEANPESQSPESPPIIISYGEDWEMGPIICTEDVRAPSPSPPPSAPPQPEEEYFHYEWRPIFGTGPEDGLPEWASEYALQLEDEVEKRAVKAMTATADDHN